MERLLRNDTHVRALSVALAVILWFYVTTEQNPTVSRTISEVQVEIRGLDASLAVVNRDPASVTLIVEGPAQLVSNLDRGDFRASIHLADAGPGPVVAAVRVERPQGVQLVEVSPSHVITLVEPVEEVTLPVELAVRGRVAPDFRAGEPHLSAVEVIIRGARSLVNRVERVVTNVDIAGARETVEQDLTLYPIDASGRQVAGVQLIPDRVMATVPVEPLPPLAVLRVEALVTGEPAAGHAVAGEAVAVPGYVVVRAPAERLNGMDSVRTEPVDITGARQPIEARVPVALPAGVEPVGPVDVLVYVPIAPSTP